ncbi:hypothetical protein ACQPYK_35100 [Streptosporangium sp. CA-135522]|uniref:hypothetical protein n=1 Tax=Streptosporangium sp. CA-135522 TaxID=3240072 RepID=UPI003D8A93E0
MRGGPNGAIIGEGHDHRNLFFLSQDFEETIRDLPGFLPFPRVDFNLDPAHTVTSTLEVRFDFQLEGIAGTKFGTHLVSRDALLRLSQWTIGRL